MADRKLERAERNMASLSSGRNRSVGCAKGTFGELLQGVIGPKQEKFLVTMPIGRSSVAHYEYSPAPICIEPAHKIKSLLMAQKILADLGKPLTGKLRIESNLPEGKGLASSSADMVATARAILAYWQVGAYEEKIARLACEIEPTDGVMYDGHVGFAHTSGRLLCRMETELSFGIVAYDEGGTVDTVAFNSETQERAANSELYTCLLPMLEHAFRQRDRKIVGWVSTISAILNQELLPKVTLGPILDICREYGALGVVVAHSGTCVGVLINPDDPRCHDKYVGVSKCIQGLGFQPWIEVPDKLPTLREEQAIQAVG